MKNCKYVLFFSFLFIAWLNVAGQPPLNWVKSPSAGGIDSDNVEAVFVDAAGNTYATGSFKGALILGGFSLNAGGTTQLFVVKYNAAGIVQWARQGFGNKSSYGHSIFVDALGCTYIGGHHTNTNLTVGSLVIPSTASRDPFILKLNPSGIPIHLKGPNIGSTGKGEILGITGNGTHVFVTGFFFQNPLNFGGNLTGAPIQEDIFIAKLDSALSSSVWVGHHGGTKMERGTDIAFDGTEVFVTGYYDNSTCTIIAPGPDYILPNFGNNSIWLLKCQSLDGAVNWATSAGSSIGDSESHGIVVNAGSIFITGFHHNNCNFVSPTTVAGPYVYGGTATSNGQSDIFVAKYDYSGSLQTLWTEGGTGVDKAKDISLDISCSEVEICGNFTGTMNMSGSNVLIANGQDIFVASYDLSGSYKWSFQEIGSGNQEVNSICSRNGRSSFGGGILSPTTFHTSPPTLVNIAGAKDHFVSSFQCASAVVCGPEITCPPNDTVTANAACNYSLTNYVGTEIVVDGCAVGYSVSQLTSPGTILPAGSHQINMLATDNSGNTDLCFFNLVVEANVNPTIVNCGDFFNNQTTLGQSNTSSSFSCVPTITPGEDIYYQTSVPAGNHLIYVTMSDVIDVNDPYVNVFWLGTNCPTTSTCTQADSLNVSTGNFSNGSNKLTFSATGPGTFYFVVDSKTDYIQNFDLEFDCLVSAIEFDQTGCSVADTDLDGVVAFVNGSSSTLEVEPCETVTICHDLYVANPNNDDWVDSVNLILGPCYENINNSSLTPDTPPNDNGFFEVEGEWTANYIPANNSIVWQFANSSGNPFGDGIAGNYNCSLYSFCFTADITANCSADDSLDIYIVIGDAGQPNGSGITTSGYDATSSNDFTVLSYDPNFTYSAASFCQGDVNPLPTITGTAGGTFTAAPGIIFTDGSPSVTGEIDLLASTAGGPYTINYNLGLCPITQAFNVTIYTEDIATFNYAAAYCQGDANPLPSITGTVGGTFTADPGIIFTDGSPSATGEIDLAASTVGGPYTITYLTPGPNCPNSATFNVTINLEDNPAFSYPTLIYCQGDLDPSPTITGTTGGTFTAAPGIIFTDGSPSASGQIDLSASTGGGTYAITYTSPGPLCPNTSVVNVTINIEDNSSFTYAAAYCQGDANPLPTLTGTTGGTFTADPGIIFTDGSPSATGQIDLAASTVGGPYTVTYTTPGPLCPNSSNVDVSINLEDDPTFNYAPTYCQGDANPLPTITGTLAGTFTADPGIVFVDGSPSATGEIDLMASTTGGPYTITYLTPGPDCPNSATYQLTINLEDNPTYSYSSTLFCQGDINPTPTITGTLGGNFTADPGIVFTDGSPSATGEIDLAASTGGGTYAVTYTTPGPLCPNTSILNITIELEDDPSFSYATAYCNGNSNPLPTITGTSGGTFTSDPGIVFVDGSPSATGQIDLALSTVGGPYTITYLTPGPNCINTSTFDVIINQEDDASFSYNSSAYCQGDLNPLPTITGTIGGTFTADPGIIFVGGSPSLIGEIDLAASTGGNTYQVTYTTPGPLCPQSLQFAITINLEENSFFSYDDTSYCSSETNPSAISIATPNGIFSGPPELIFLNNTTGEIDLSSSTIGGPYLITYTTPGPTCINTSSFNIYIFEGPTANAGYDQELNYLFNSTLNAAVPVLGTGQWSNSSDSSVIIDPTNPITAVTNLALGQNIFFWTVTHESCDVVADSLIIYVNDLFFPQAVTPNGDNHNDYFVVEGIENISNTLQVFNRWGQLVFETNNYVNDWDGIDNYGNELVSDTYFYIANLEGDRAVSGYIVLKR